MYRFPLPPLRFPVEEGAVDSEAYGFQRYREKEAGPDELYQCWRDANFQEFYGKSRSTTNLDTLEEEANLSVRGK